MSNPAPKYKWTVMIYLAGDNNLTDECVHALTQMKEVEGLDQICVLAQFDPKGGRLKSHRYKISPVTEKPSMSGDFQEWVENEKKFFHKDFIDVAAIRAERDRVTNERPVTNRKDRETNTGSPVTLFDFVTWGIEKHPAESYMLVLSGHGGGTEKGYLLRDEHPADALTMWEMQVGLEAIRDSHKVDIDILGMDCCLMTMAEVSYQLKGLAKLMVGSEGYSPIAGWPFKPVLTRMRDELNRINEEDPEKRKELERVAIANGVVEEYVNYYLDYSIGGLSVEQSSVDLRHTESLKTAIDNLAAVLLRELENKEFQNALVLAHWKAQSYNGEQFVDLYDFCALLMEHYPSGEVGNVCTAVLKTEGTFVTRSCYSGPTYQYSHGVSIYFPWAEIDPDYKDVIFGRESVWLQFLKAYVVATRRQQRHPVPEGRDKDTKNLFGNNQEAFAIRHTAGKHAPGKAMLPEVLSMRNPPLSAGLSPCVRDPEVQADSFKGMVQAWTATAE